MNRHCIEVQLGGLLWRVRHDSLDQVRPVCEDVEAAIAASSKFYKNSLNVTVAAIRQPHPLVVRRLNYGTLRHGLKDFVRPSRARRAFFRGLRLEDAGVRTPKMLAVAEVRKLRWPVAAYLVCDEVPQAQTLARWLRSRRRESARVPRRLAETLARLHDRGFVHRDLKPSNVLLDGDLYPWLIDMDGVRFVTRVSTRQIVRDFAVLARVLAEQPELRRSALRFLLRYCQVRGLMPRRREIARRVMAKSGLGSA